MTNEKTDKDTYYLNIAKAVADKSNCRVVAFGAIIVRDDQIISTGYVGSPRKTKDCMDLGFCIRRRNNIESGRDYEICRSVHAEMNAIINAARAGVSLLNGDLYLYTSRKDEHGLTPTKAYPCLICKKMIINAGLKRFIGSNPDGSSSIYLIDDWVTDWQDLEDLTQDREQYRTEYRKS